MLIICTNLSTQNPDIESSVKNKDAQTVRKIVQEAKTLGFNALMLNCSNSANEAEDLSFLIDTIGETDLTLILRIKNNATYEAVIPKVKQGGILNPIKINVEQAKVVFNLLKELEDNWKVMFTQCYGDDSVSDEIEDSKTIIAAAEQNGILPERIWIEPLTEPIASSNSSYLKMKRLYDAFSNVYPSMNFYINLADAAEGLQDKMVLVNVFIAMATQLGIQAYSFDMEHKEHIEAINASSALLYENGGISEYLKK